MSATSLSWLVWYWLCVQLAYWTIVFVGVRRFDRFRSGSEPGATTPALEAVIPAFNEKHHLPMIAANLAAAQAAGVSAIVVDDGSTDGSPASLQALCQEKGSRLLAHEVNRGKSVALQTGLQAVTTPVALLVDADTRVSVDGACRTAVPRDVGAVAFTIVAIENSRLAVAQACEYEYILNFERQALAGYGVVLTVPGSASLWRKEALAEVGGFSRRTEAEDTDATLAMQAAGWKIAVSDVPADTDCPATLSGLVRQRGRWIWGNLQAAVYAVAGAFGPGPVATRRPAMVMASLGVLNLLGTIAATSVIVRIAMLDLGRMDAVAAVIFGAATVGRIEVTRRMRSVKPRAMLQVVAALMVMQMVNLAAFWHGGVRRALFRRAW